jgi:hypothetical protein
MLDVIFEPRSECRQPVISQGIAESSSTRDAWVFHTKEAVDYLPEAHARRCVSISPCYGRLGVSCHELQPLRPESHPIDRTRQLSHSLCECALLLVEPGIDELDRGEPAVGGVRPVDVVIDAPVLCEHLGLAERVEALSVEKLVA